MTRQQRIIVATLSTIGILGFDYMCVELANAKPVAHIPEARARYVLKIRTASVGSRWDGPLGGYTGGSYYSGHVNQLWPSAPRGKRRQIILDAAAHHHVPFRLLLGIWGAESGFGRYACHFGLTGNYPGRGTSGNFRKDAHMAADILDRLYRSRYNRPAI
jgi:hypothetical protein